MLKRVVSFMLAAMMVTMSVPGAAYIKHVNAPNIQAPSYNLQTEEQSIIASSFVFQEIDAAPVSTNRTRLTASAGLPRLPVKTAFSGKAVDINGLSLPGVSVLVYDIDENEVYGYSKTDEAGAWRFEEAEAGVNYRVRYYHPLYRFSDDTQNVTGTETALNLDTAIGEKIAAFEGVITPDADFTYQVEDVYYAVITEYTGDASTVIVPEMIDGYKVRGLADGVFKERSNLEAVALPDAVASIGNYAFNNCIGLVDIQLPNGLISIGESAFYGCHGLTAVTLPDSVEEISYLAFGNCTNLSSINYPLGWARAPGWHSGTAFKGSDKLTHITVPEGVTSLPEYVFANCTNFTSITLPSTLTSISKSAFNGCSNLREVNIPEQVTAIGNGAFYECIGLVDIQLPNGLISIGESAFYGCHGLTAVTLPDSVEEISYLAFGNCTNLSSINYPLGWARAPGWHSGTAFKGSDKLTHITVPEGVTSLPEYVFANCTNFTSITLPSTLTSISKSAFYGCSNLREVNIPEQVTAIGNGAFYECIGLVDIQLPNGLISIGESAFYGCHGLTAVTLPDSVEEISYLAFGNCTNLSSINYPLGWARAPGWHSGTAFKGSDKLTHITVPEGVTSLPEYVFANCTNFTSITLPSTLTSISKSAFYGCSNLREVNIPEQVTAIGNGAFYECIGLVDIQLPNGLISIGESAFYGCHGLTAVTLPDSVEEISYLAFGNCTNLSSINYPLGWARAPGWHSGTAFKGSDKLTHITVPEGVTSLPEYVFANCTNFTSITLPSTLTSISKSAFYGCSNLREVNIPEQVTSIEENAFLDCPQLTIHGVSGTYAESYAIEQQIAFSDQPMRIERQSQLLGHITNSYGVGLLNVSVMVYDLERNEVCGYSKTDEAGAWRFEEAEAGVNYRVRYYHPLYRFSDDTQNVTGTETALNLDTAIGEKIAAFEGVITPDADFTYQVEDVYYAVITEYTGDASTVIVPEMIDGYKVRGLADGVFKERSNLEAVALPDAVASIGNYAFNNCIGLVDIQLPNGLISIGESAFYGCHGLTTVTLPDSVEEISYLAFGNCTNLSSINYPLGWARAPGWHSGTAFKGSDKLTHITVPEGVTSLPEYVFANCTNFTSITLPSTLTSISKSAFYGCSNLREVNIPEQVTAIGNGAFYECIGLVDIQLPNGLISIGESAFYGCHGLTAVTLPDSVEEISYLAFGNCTNLSSINYPLGWARAPGWHSGTAFKGSDKLTHITVPEGVTSLPEYVFANCTNFTSITLPSTLTSISKSAFYGCSNLREVNIPEQVTAIGNGAFYECIGLVDIQLPNGLISIGESAFYGCHGLTAVTLPDSVEEISYLAFGNCTNLSSINYPLGWARAPGWYSGTAFKGSDKLTHITVPEGVTSLPEYVFANCTNFTSITLPSTLTSISKSAFYGCSNLREVNIPEQVTSIEENAFLDCPQLTIHGVSGTYAESYAIEQQIAFSDQPMRIERQSQLLGHITNSYGVGLLNVSVMVYDLERNEVCGYSKTDEAGAWRFEEAEAGVNYRVRYYHPLYRFSDDTQNVTGTETALNLDTAIGEKIAAFEGVITPDADFTYQVEDVYYAVITEYTGDASTVIVPEMIDGYKVRGLADGVFKERSNLEAVALPDAVASIGNYAFNNCIGLVDIQLPNGLISIGESAFYGCHGLTAVTLPDSVEEISYLAFGNCTNLSSINYPLGWARAPGWHSGTAFKGSDKLTHITVPEGVTSLPEYVFANCTNFTSITLPSTLTSISKSAFYGCSNLREVNIPEQVTAIGNGAFYECIGLVDIQLPNGLISIGESAFYGCHGLTAVTLPDSVEEISYLAFGNCTNLSSINYPLGWARAPGWHSGTAFKGSDKLTHITVPEGVTSLPEYVFANCTNFTSITLPSTLTSISKSAFNGCSNLREVNIPEQVTAIGNGAFYECIGLVDIQLPNGLISIGESAFYGCHGLTAVTLPDSVEEISYLAFGNCTNLSSINYPLGWARAPGWHSGTAFKGSDKLTHITVPEGVTSLPECVFANCTNFTSITLPSTLTSISKSAFYGCSNLRFIIVPSNVTDIGNMAFANCSSLDYALISGRDCTLGSNVFEGSDKLLLYVYENSDATWSAVIEGVPFMLMEEEQPEFEGYVLDMDKTGIFTSEAIPHVSKPVSLVLDYEIAAHHDINLLDNQHFQVALSNTLEIDERTGVAIDGQYVQYELRDNVLTVPVSKKSGRMQLSVVPVTVGNIAVSARFSYRNDGAEHTEHVGVMLLDVPMLALFAPSTVSTTSFYVNGVTDGSKTVILYVDGQQVAQVRSRKDGTFETYIDMQEAPGEGHEYILKAVRQDDKEIISEVTIVYCAESPTLIQFDMYYQAHSQQYLNLLATAGTRQTNMIYPGHEFKFVLKFDNHSKIGRVYVSSNRNGITSKIEAYPTENEGEYVAAGFFEGTEKNYVPGTINACYTMKTTVEDYSKPLDREELPDNWQNAVVDVITDTAKEYEGVITLADGEKIQIERKSSLSIQELRDELLGGAKGQSNIQSANNGVHDALPSLERAHMIASSNPGNLVFPVSSSLVQDSTILDPVKEFIGEEILSLINDLHDEYQDNMFSNAMDLYKDEDVVAVIKDDINKKVQYVFWDSAKKAATTAGIKYLGTTWIYETEKHFGGTWAESAKAWGFLSNTAMTAAGAYDNLISLRDAEADIWSSSSLTEEQKIYAIEKVDQLKWGIGAIAALRMTAAIADYGLSAAYGPIAGTTASVIINIVADLAENYLHKALAYYVAGGQGSYLKWIIDPSGYVYDQQTGERLPEVIVSAYWVPNEEDDPAYWDEIPDIMEYGELWDATEYRQINPMDTDEAGAYAWDVPEGWWRVKYEKDGYETTWSEWLPVPPPQTDVNIGLVPVQ